MKILCSILASTILFFFLPLVSNSQSTQFGKITDIDGNSYTTVQIGTQGWMKENLKTTKFNDGTLIPIVTDTLKWTALTTPGFSWYNNNAFYNFYTVSDKRGLCPSGWHIPTEADWNLLISFIGEENVKLRLTHIEGFNAVLGGFRSSNGGFFGVGITSSWWSSTESSKNKYYAVKFSINGGERGFDNLAQNKKGGGNIRCIKD